MNRTREDFCRKLLDDDSPHDALNPERLAAPFVRYFNLSDHPALDELKALMERAGFGAVEEWEMDGLKGAHIGRPRGRYRIYCRGDLWEGTKRPTRCSTKPTRSSWRPCATSTPTPRRSGGCAGRPTALRRRP